jgi:hypothetical protein
MAKKITRSKKTQAEAPALEVAPVVASAPVPVVAGETPTKPVKARKEKVVETAEIKWRRRLARWSKKAQAAGADPKALMEEALAG